MTIDWPAFWGTVLALLVVFTGLAIVAYIVVRRVLMRAADRASRHVEVMLNQAVRSPYGEWAARAASRFEPGTVTNLGRYARAEGMDEGRARQEFHQQVERIARLMDSAVRLPVIGPVGLDALLGLVPFVGDAASAMVALTIVARSLRYGIPRELLLKMLANVLIDVLMGAVPVVGDVADVWYRANNRNVTLLKKYLDERAAADPDGPGAPRELPR